VQCTSQTKKETVAIIMELGVAHICLITDYTSLLIEKISLSLPAKKSRALFEAKQEKFFKAILEALVRHFNIDMIKCCIVASPGFYKDKFLASLFDPSQISKFSTNSEISQFLKVVQMNKSKFLAAHASSGYLDSLSEILKDPSIQAKISQTKSLKETDSLNVFFDTLRLTPDKAYYGLHAVQVAIQLKAVKTLLISSTLLRSNEISTRKLYQSLIDSFKRESRGNNHLESSYLRSF
jgi:protein pelota